MNLRKPVLACGFYLVEHTLEPVLAAVIGVRDISPVKHPDFVMMHLGGHTLQNKLVPRIHA